jgi:glycosyltransferase involved in cell wall biosynthesis
MLQRLALGSDEKPKPGPSVAIVHDWFTNLGGAEEVVAALADICPNSEFFTVFNFVEKEVRELTGGRPVHVSRLNDWPLVSRYYRRLVLLAARQVEQFDLSRFDAVISSSAAISKGVLTRPDQPHIAYIHTPARYAWDQAQDYRRLHGLERGIRGLIAREMMHRFRMWDVATTNGIDVVVANSRFIAKRIWKVYRREAEVVYPPVATTAFGVARRWPSHFVTAGRLVGYKRFDLVVRAFARRPDLKLVVIGEGPELSHLKSIAPKNVEFTGRIARRDMLDIYADARAFIHAAVEDFGIAPVEAQAAGLPVIALGKGGALETIVGLGAGPAPTGVHFAEQTVDGLLDGLSVFEEYEDRFNPDTCRRNARRFDESVFRRRMSVILDQALNGDEGRQDRRAVITAIGAE